ncbi:MAG: GTPase HflX [Planctomycetota bacterium]
METGQREKLAVASERAVLVACLLPDTEVNPHDPLDELRALAETAGAVVVDEMLQKRQKPSAKSFLGKGKVQELAERVKLHQAQVVILENDLSPSQIGNIEKVCEVKVLDRSELILDIFAARARTHEARLQVELAQLEYTYPRLRAMWTHLERIVGGAPAGIGTRGPGEQQLEIDRRIVQRKKSILKKEIASLQSRKTREVESRNTDHFTVGLVGYTNAGKSTLFNTVTDADAYAADQLFATLSTRTREWKLGNGDTVMLSDTVGFVRNLPHHLVASFKATLEEAVHSHLLLVVLDVSDPHCLRQLATVNTVLEDIGATDQPRILVLNKIDKVDHNADLLLLQKQHPEAISLSAATGRNVDTLVEAVRDQLHGGTVTLTLDLAQADGKALTFLENRATVIDRDYRDTRVHMTVKIGRRQLDQLQSMGTSAILPEEFVGAAGGGWGR